MTTDRLTAPEPGHMLHPFPEAQAQTQIDELHRLTLECQRFTAEADSLIRQSSRLLSTSEACLRKSAALITGHRSLIRVRWMS